ncbi:MAG: hypothetical protein ABIU97_00180, partial [Dehalococcoidia bacterium]
IVQAVRGDAAWWVSAVSFPAAILAVGLAMGRVFGRAVRLGGRTDPPDVQSELARSICRRPPHLPGVDVLAAGGSTGRRLSEELRDAQSR